MIARNFILAILAAVTLLAAGFTMGQMHANDSNIRTVVKTFNHNVVPAPPNTTTGFSFVNNIIPNRDNHSNKASTQDARSGAMRSGFGNK